MAELLEAVILDLDVARIALAEEGTLAVSALEFQVRVQDVAQGIESVIDVVMAAEDEARRIDQDLRVSAHHRFVLAALDCPRIQILAVELSLVDTEVVEGR
jgi:hypothetical protein